MSTYAIGDLQGCFDELIDLLNEINFDNNNDRLWFTGDLVNRGPQSLECLRFVKSLDSNAITVLGNHDLHLLAIANGQEKYIKEADTLQDILSAPDREELLNWLRQCPLLHHDSELGFTMIHAGLHPQWSLDQSMACASEIETVLSGNHYKDYFAKMYGNEPDTWSEDLTDWDRLRFITNCFTRMRYCAPDGRLDLKQKGPPGTQASPYIPWFKISNRQNLHLKIIFGHWATLLLSGEDYSIDNVFPIDTGCLWGRQLTALRLEDMQYFSVPSQQSEF